MYLWNTNKLVADHKAGPLPQYEQFKYFFVYILLISAALEIPASSDEPFTLINIFSAISSLAVTIIGTLLVFRANANGDNYEFLSRYFSLSLPILIRIAAFLVLFSFPYFAIAELGLGINVTSSTNWGDVIILNCFDFLYYWRLYVHIHDISHHNNAGQPISQAGLT